MKHVLLCAALLCIAAAGCATICPITAENNVLEMPSYALAVPPDKGWNLEERGTGVTERLLITRSQTGRHYSVVVARSPILDATRRKWTSDAVAREFLAMEREGMHQRGVRSGMYELRNVRTENLSVAGRQYHGMTWEARDARARTRSAIYLLFRTPRSNEEFFLVLLSEAVQRDEAYDTAWPAEVRSILSGLTLRSQ